MVEFKTQKPKIAVLLNNQVEITFTANKSVIGALEGLDDSELTVSIKKYSKKRTLSQNAYMWAIMEEIAQKTQYTKEKIYKQYIKDYGVFEILPIKNDAVESFKNKWGKNGLGWFCQDLGESKLDGFTKLIAYYGSSTYNSVEMARVIDAVVNDANDLGISTLTLKDIMLLKNDNDKE